MQHPENPKIKGIVFDMEGVLCDSLWTSLFYKLGIGEKHEELKRNFEMGEYGSYMEWTDDACRTLKDNGLTKDKFMEIVKSNEFSKGAEHTLKTLNVRGYKIGIITGGIKDIATRAKQMLSADFAVASCDFRFKGGYLDSWNIIPSDNHHKVTRLEEFASKYGFAPEECAYIGNGINDIPAMDAAGVSIAWNPNHKSVEEAANIVIVDGDMRSVLKYFPPFRV